MDLLTQRIEISLTRNNAEYPEFNLFGVEHYRYHIKYPNNAHSYILIMSNEGLMNLMISLDHGNIHFLEEI